ncbi:MAG: hypothetical protein KAW56_09590 [Candidatus Marinimicrobia bacterium]|nr:hypothetical protein [Candidatus Neomarinimicrobiota bacterium]
MAIVISLFAVIFTTIAAITIYWYRENIIWLPDICILIGSMVRAEIGSGTSSADYILVDGPPGIGCPTISSISGSDLLVTVSEAGVSGIHDSSRLLGLADQFNINSICIMNKTGLNIEAEDKFEGFLKEKNIPVIGNIPFNEKFMALLNNRLTWLETSDRELKEHLISIWDLIKLIVQ